MPCLIQLPFPTPHTSLWKQSPRSAVSVLLWLAGLPNHSRSSSTQGQKEAPGSCHFPTTSNQRHREPEPCARAASAAQAPLSNLPGTSLLSGRERMDAGFCGLAVGCCTRRNVSSVWNNCSILGVTWTAHQETRQALV